MGRIAAHSEGYFFASVHFAVDKESGPAGRFALFLGGDVLLLGLTTKSVPAFYCLPDPAAAHRPDNAAFQAGDRGSGTTLPLMAHAFHVISGRCLPPEKRPPRHRAGRSKRRTSRMAVPVKAPDLPSAEPLRHYAGSYAYFFTLVVGTKPCTYQKRPIFQVHFGAAFLTLHDRGRHSL